MAESLVEEPLGFFCHRCWMEIRPVLPSYLCPYCSTGFIEELDSAQSEQPVTQSALLVTSEADSSMEDLGFFIESTHNPSNPFLQRYIRDRHYPGGGAVRARPRATAYLRDDRTDIAIRRGLDSVRDRIAELQRVDLYTRHYAWNREGLDAIVTHLLNQMDVSGPPPLAKERIDEIPVVNIVQQQVDASLQCPVCWEDFRIEESVRKLMCEHVFHESCIIPWLELHGTCPVCRKWLFEEGGAEDPDHGQSAEEESDERIDGRQRRSDLSSQLETLLSSGLDSLPELSIHVDVSPDPESSNHDMSYG